MSSDESKEFTEWAKEVTKLVQLQGEKLRKLEALLDKINKRLVLLRRKVENGL